MSQVGFREVFRPDPNWECYLFGSTPAQPGLIYVPHEGQVPNWFVRWMMKVMLGCTWVKKVDS